jgi:hypothetical protein
MIERSQRQSVIRVRAKVNRGGSAGMSRTRESRVAVCLSSAASRGRMALCQCDSPPTRGRGDAAFSKSRTIANCAISRQELHAISLAATPDHFAGPALLTARQGRKTKAVAHVHRGIGHDPGAAGRDVEHDAFAPCGPVLQRDPGRMLGQLASRFALDLGSRFVNNHDERSVIGLRCGRQRRSRRRPCR